MALIRARDEFTPTGGRPVLSGTHEIRRAGIAHVMSRNRSIRTFLAIAGLAFVVGPQIVHATDWRVHGSQREAVEGRRPLRPSARDNSDGDVASRNVIINQYNALRNRSDEAARRGDFREAARLRREALRVHEGIGENQASRNCRGWMEYYDRLADARDADQLHERNLAAGRPLAQAYSDAYLRGDYAAALAHVRQLIMNPAYVTDQNRNIIAMLERSIKEEQARIAEAERIRLEKARIEEDNRQTARRSIDGLIADLADSGAFPELEVRSALFFRSMSGPKAPDLPRLTATAPPAPMNGVRPAPDLREELLPAEQTRREGVPAAVAGSSAPHAVNGLALKQLRFMNLGIPQAASMADGGGERANHPAGAQSATPRPTVAAPNSISAGTTRDQALAAWKAAMANPGLTAADRAAAYQKYGEANAAYQSELAAKARLENR